VHRTPAATTTEEEEEAEAANRVDEVLDFVGHVVIGAPVRPPCVGRAAAAAHLRALLGIIVAAIALCHPLGPVGGGGGASRGVRRRAEVRGFSHCAEFLDRGAADWLRGRSHLG
jgi:hypothetical protein